MSRKTVVKEGDRYGRLTVIKEIEPFVTKGLRKERRLLCKCDCGQIGKYILASLQAGHTKSCGCYRKHVTAKRSITHGLTNHKLYEVWSNIKKRCYDKNYSRFSDWGGRGIKMCDEWRHDFKKFFDFAISHGWKKGLQIDRIDNDGNYEPNNCRFVTSRINNRNKRLIKLTEEKAVEIRKLLYLDIKQKQIAEKFDVCISTISYIKRNKHWQQGIEAAAGLAKEAGGLF